MTVWERIKEANRTGPPEESIEVRIAVLATVLVALIALMADGLVGGLTIGAALFGVPAGFAYSYQTRHSDNLGLKALLAAALLLAMGVFFGRLVDAAADGFANVQIPLAELFVWVQVIHSLHVPARRDLMFSLVSSGVTLAVVAALSITLTLGVFLTVWSVGLVVSLVLAHRSELRSRPSLAERPAGLGQGAGAVAAKALAGIAAGALVMFLLMPSARATRAFTFPTNLPSAVPVGEDGALENRSLGDGGSTDDGSDFADRAAFGYFGFAESLDTSLRGRPDDTLVMRVRAPAPAFWRGQTFDTWDGRVWTLSDDTPLTIGGDGNPIAVRPTAGDELIGPGEEFIQTFYVETPGPNVIFGAYRISDVYFPERFLFELPEGTLRSGVSLLPGSVYTVVSSRPAATADILRDADPRVWGVPPDIAARYLQVPASTPDRVIELAASLAANQPSSYDTVRAMETWMAENTTYSLDIPPLAPGRDAVDDYLFETRQGFCEQIGTSLVVMLRSQGIPARLVVGYVPGERNPFTGLYEVKASDAHSWAEVYFPGIGWQGFDPTAHVPLAGEFDPPRAAEGLGAFLSGRFGAWAGRIAGVLGYLAMAAIVGVIGYLGLAAARRRRATRAMPWPARMLDRLDRAGALRGRPRRPAETTTEYVASLVDGPLADDRLFDVFALVSAAALGPDPVSEAERTEATRRFDEIIDRHPVRLRRL